MLKKIINKMLRHRHFWRDVSFDELSELYIVSMLRGLAMSLSGLFVPMYMLRLGYDVTTVITLVAWFFTFRIVLDIISAFVIARIGPKHTIIYGYLFQIISTLLFVIQSKYQFPIWLLGGVWGASSTFYFIPFHVDFSKVKIVKHSGKEIGYVNIMERIGAMAGPVIGGFVATLFGGQYIFVVAAIILVIGLIPLLKTTEPVRTRQKITIGDLNISDHIFDYISYAAIGIENTLSVTWWSLYLASFVLITKASYAQFGLLMSCSFIVSIICVRLIGCWIDTHNRRARQMLRVNIVLNAVLDLLRPLVKAYPLTFLINFANEIITPGYRLPYIKGFYNAADELPGHRIVYIASMEAIASIAKATCWWLLVLIAGVLQGRQLFGVGFIVAAFASCVILTERFKILTRKNHV